jgi:hypothetical protein
VSDAVNRIPESQLSEQDQGHSANGDFLEDKMARRCETRIGTWMVMVLGVVMLLGAAPLLAQQMPPDTRPEDLKPGEWVWDAEAAPSGPLVVLVSLSQQFAYVYRNGIVIGYCPVATGKPGHETPTGVFTILQKDKDHVSNLYKAKMPYTQRLTWSGICLHAGTTPGYPNSHGCIHLPLEFSRLLYEIEELGGTVVIADDHSGPAEAAHPGMVLSAVNPDSASVAVPAAFHEYESVSYTHLTLPTTPYV